MKKVIALLALLLPAVGCATTRAQAPPQDHPALVVPPVPPRTIEPLPTEPPAIEPVGELPTAPVNPPRPRPTNRENNNRPPAAEPKPEAKPADTPPVDPTVQQTASVPVPPLRPPGTSDGPEAERQIRDTLERAQKLLDRVDYKALQSDSRQNYENAKSFMRQADDALKAKDVASAKRLADRAETIAKLLAGL